MTVHLVGAGPGDPGLLTLRAAELLAAADVVIHDRLVDPRIVARARPGATVIDVGKSPRRSSLTQAAINDLLLLHGRSGATVVRLKGGDPYVFGRGGEEAEALLAAGIAVEVVPGVSAAFAAPAAAGIPVTQRQVALSATVVTGHEDPDGDTSVDWDAVARLGGTIVVLMGAARIAAIAERLLAGGLAPTTPVAVVRWGTRPEQEVLRSDLVSIAGHALSSPCTIVIGAVAGLDLAAYHPEA